MYMCIRCMGFNGVISLSDLETTQDTRDAISCVCIYAARSAKKKYEARLEFLRGMVMILQKVQKTERKVGKRNF